MSVHQCPRNSYLKFQHNVIKAIDNILTTHPYYAKIFTLRVSIKSILGEPGVDYPIYASAPVTSFSCSGRPDGLYSDVEGQCQSWHQCHHDRMWTFLCPNGTIFNQEIFTCVWWFNYECQSSFEFYSLNNNLYKTVENSNISGPTPIPRQRRIKRKLAFETRH